MTAEGFGEKEIANAVKSYEKSTFYPTDILKECPKFRILVIGQAGAGKTTICSKVFNVDAKNGGTVRTPEDLGLTISAHARGTDAAQVWKEVIFEEENKDIILHDSGGFDAGNETKFDEIRKLLKDRLSRTALSDQLHCIWYCIPLLGHRQIQASEERFFTKVDVGEIPVIAVFTHFDVIENDYELSLMKAHRRNYPNTVMPSDVSERAHAFAVKDYDEIYRPALEKLTGSRSKVAFRRIAVPPDDPSGAQGIDDLVRTTFEMLTKDGCLRRLWTAAQQQDAELKREESIGIAMEYLSTINISNSLLFVPFLGGQMFASSFNHILSLVSQSWGLIDKTHELQIPSTRKRFFEACLNLSAAGRIGAKTGMALNFLGPLTAPFITAALLKTAAGLIMMHEDLFWKQREKQGLRLNVETVRQIAADFMVGEGRGIAAAYIDSKVDVTNYAKKIHCREVLTTAVRLARGEETWQQMRKAKNAGRR